MHYQHQRGGEISRVSNIWVKNQQSKLRFISFDNEKKSFLISKSCLKLIKITIFKNFHHLNLWGDDGIDEGFIIII